MSNFTKQPLMKATPNPRIRFFSFLSQPFWLVCSLSWLLTNPVFAQRNLTLSQLSFAPQSYLVNPGRIPLTKYNIGLPLMSGANGAVSSSGFKLGDFQEGNSIEGTPVNPYKKFLDGLDQQNQASMDISVNLLDLGFRIGKRNYFNFFANENMNAAMSYPRSMAEMLFNVGNSKIVDRTYDIQTYRLNVLQYRAIGLGYTRQITNKLSAGIRVKSLMGISHVQTLNDSMRFVSDKDDRYFGVLGNLSFMSSGASNLDPYYATLGNLNFSNLAVQALQRNPSTYFQNTGNKGFAVDLGLQYRINDEIDLYASVLNVGSITWKKGITINPIADDNIEFPTQDLKTYNQEVLEFIDSLGRKPNFDTTFSTKLPMLLYVGGSYFVNPTTSIDVTINPRFYLGEIDFGIAVGVTSRVNKFLQVGGNISSFNKASINFGLGTALNLGPAQLFFVTDNALAALSFKSAKTAHFNLGLTFNIGRQTRDDRIVELDGKKKVEKKKKEEDKPLLAQNKNNKDEPKTVPRSVPPSLSISLIGTVFNSISKEQLTGISLEVFMQNEDGTEAVITKRTFGNGIILMSLKRDHNHRLVLRKSGFAPTEIILTTDEMGGLPQMKREFELTAGVQAAPPTIEAPAEPEEIRVPDRIIEPATKPIIVPEQPVTVPEKPIVVPEKPAPRPETQVSKPSSRPGRVIVYRVLENSAIRQHPDENSLDLLPVVIGHRLELMEKTNSEWWKVRFRDFVGYLPARILELEE